MRGKHIKRRLCGEEVANAQATAADTREMLEDVKRLRSELSALRVRNTKLESIKTLDDLKVLPIQSIFNPLHLTS